MGALKRILITGANGFVGSAALRRARSDGIAVTALYRRHRPEGWSDDPGITAAQLDLNDPASVDALRPLIAECDAVIHAAAHLGGDKEAIARDTIRATSHLLDAMQPGSARLVLVSSIAVYDMMQLDRGSEVTERCPLVDPAAPRDAYSAGKFEQERLVAARNRPAWLMRAGAVYGPGRTWHALMGLWLGKLFVEVASDGALPMVHVDHLADALLAAAARDPEGVEAVNVLDDDLPTRARYAGVHRAASGWPRLRLPIPYALWLGAARLAAPLRSSMPGLLREDALRARMMPVTFSNARLRDRLGGRDRAPFEAMLKRSIEDAG
ncbi:NAD-dependent epimerase/dehydratase family protein [Cognatishimia sp. F0-27]|nr:NAD-dependent epimerase/dehydratase family protein [Cognatishimia sp. F0-27]